MGNAALVGDKHKFVSVLISPNFAALAAMGEADRGFDASDRAALVAGPEGAAAVSGHCRPGEWGAGARLRRMKRFRLVPEEWSLEGGELTPSMKLKRRVVEKQYAAEIAAFYKDEATAAG